MEYIALRCHLISHCENVSDAGNTAHTHTHTRKLWERECQTAFKRNVLLYIYTQSLAHRRAVAYSSRIYLISIYVCDCGKHTESDKRKANENGNSHKNEWTASGFVSTYQPAPAWCQKCTAECSAKTKRENGLVCIPYAAVETDFRFYWVNTFFSPVFFHFRQSTLSICRYFIFPLPLVCSVHTAMPGLGLAELHNWQIARTNKNEFVSKYTDQKCGNDGQIWNGKEIGIKMCSRMSMTHVTSNKIGKMLPRRFAALLATCVPCTNSHLNETQPDASCRMMCAPVYLYNIHIDSILCQFGVWILP